jgi:hypothetical protein
MNRALWLELCELAERHATDALLDIPVMTDTDAHGLLLWLRSVDSVRQEATR